MRVNGYTSIGGSQGSFPATHWAVIQSIQSADRASSRFLIGELLNQYWRPVYCYLRRKGYRDEDAQDLTQGFFQEVVLGRELIRRADPARGPFRRLLLTALDRYLASIGRRQRARRRIPAHRLISLEHLDTRRLPQVEPDPISEESFGHPWISRLLHQVSNEVEGDCHCRGMEMHWRLFHDRVLQPIIEDTEPPPLAHLCAQYGIPQVAKASNMIFAVKKRFRSALKQHMRRSAADEEKSHEELAELMHFVTRRQQCLPVVRHTFLGLERTSDDLQQSSKPKRASQSSQAKSQARTSPIPERPGHTNRRYP